MTRLLELPVELVKMVLEQIACTFGLARLLRLRLVSKLFDEYIMDEFIFTKAVAREKMILACEDKTAVTKYLHWVLYHQPVGSSATIDALRDTANLFVSKSGSKYEYDTATRVLLSLFGDELIRQRMQFHPHYVPSDYETAHEYKTFKAPFIWWTAPHWGFHSGVKPGVSAEQACFIMACAVGDQSMVCNLLAKNNSVAVNPAYQHYLGLPIQAAVRNGQKETTRYLLGRSSKVMYGNGWNVLTEAVLSHQVEILEMLVNMDLDFPMDILDIEHYHNDTRRPKEDCDAYYNALGQACRSDDMTSFNILFSKVTQPLSLEVLQLLLFSACQGPAPTMSRTLFELYPSLDPNFQMYVASRRIWTRFRRLPRSPLAEAASRGDTNLVKVLLYHGADPNFSGNRQPQSPMEAAAHQGHVPCMKILLEAGAETEACEWSPLNRAIASGNPVAVELLLDNGYSRVSITDEQRNNRNLLTGAHVDGVQSIIDMLIADGYDNDEAIRQAREATHGPLFLDCHFHRDRCSSHSDAPESGFADNL